MSGARLFGGTAPRPPSAAPASPRAAAADVADGPGRASADASAPRPARRPACVDVPAFPLQLLLRREPSWHGLPVVVVEKDEPQGRVLWASEEARRERVLPGHRYAAALALARGLRAGVVPEEEVRAGILEVAARLRRFTPSIDPSREEPGVFRLDAGGLSLLHPDLRAWAESLRDDLAAAGLRATAVVGWTEFGTYAVARALAVRLLPHGPRSAHDAAAPGAPRGDRRGAAPPRPPQTVVVFADAATERRALRRVPLDRLPLDPQGDGAARDLLAKLGVRTVDQFLALPAAGVGDRFGEAARRLHRLAAGEFRDPLRAAPDPDPVRATVLLEHPETDGARLLFVVKRLLEPLLLRTAERREALAGVELSLRLEGRGGRPGPERKDVLRTAAPTLDAAQVLDLVRLRLESADLATGVLEATLTAIAVPATREQLALFAETPRRDLAAADRALARLRAEFGEDAVVRARVRDGHLPEGAFAWERLAHLPLPRARPAPLSRAAPPPPLVRRLLARPLALPPRTRREPDGWMLHAPEHGPVVRLDGPYVVEGGWWAGEEVRREYHFAETARGRLFWVFHDVRRRRWFVQGEVS